MTEAPVVLAQSELRLAVRSVAREHGVATLRRLAAAGAIGLRRCKIGARSVRAGSKRAVSVEMGARHVVATAELRIPVKEWGTAE